MHSMQGAIALVLLVASSVNAAALPFNPLAPRAAVCDANARACSAQSPSPDTCCIPENGIIVFAQQWLKGYCASSSCQITPPNYWTIHGAWPDSCSGQQTQQCSDVSYSNVAGLVQSYDSSVSSQMKQFWPSYTGDNNAFWTHEWEKHGSCYSPADVSCFPNFKQGQDLTTYFRYGLNLRNKFNIGTALSNAGINPGGSYSLTQLRSAITKTYPNLRMYFKCKGKNLTEVYIGVYATATGGVSGASFSGSDSCPNTVSY
ncbi:hypothetical protein SpCBS45565_g06484 [Spizellomyces sp. 'palustris']|nr:hypothetical protein SpCBS45565_g06484 [Spizellomyces sp. 'palustris']